MIYLHNPRCSKSRAGIELLNSKDISYHIRDYVKDPLSKDELLSLFKSLGKPPSEVVRKKEAADLGFSDLSEEDWINAILEHPILLERPILMTENKAIVGRPTENLDEFLS